jgi:hypothetical protein
MGNHKEESGMQDFVKELIDQNRLEGAALGIAKRFLDQGEESLSEKQKYVFQKNVIDEFVTKECTLCGLDIPWEEMNFAYDNGGFCGYCAHLIDKDD